MAWHRAERQSHFRPGQGGMRLLGLGYRHVGFAHGGRQDIAATYRRAGGVVPYDRGGTEGSACHTATRAWYYPEKPGQNSRARDSPVMALGLCIIAHHLVWLRYADNGGMGCGIVVTDRNRCAILG